MTDAVTYSRVADAINAKASSLGYGSQDGVGVGDVTAVPGGYLRRYANHDIYSTANGTAFEVHGDIRAKYNALGGAAGLLGMPVTDERRAPDGAGRYNNFDHGSIYWTDRTGPMSVTGTVRDRWASTGWERGPFGYPVQDQHRMVPIPATDPVVEWCRFENGVIAGDAQGGKDAPPATVTYAELGAIFRARLNAQFQASPDNVALRAGIGHTAEVDRMSFLKVPDIIGRNGNDIRPRIEECPGDLAHVVSVGQQREICVAAKLPAAVEDACLSAHQQILDVVPPESRQNRVDGTRHSPLGDRGKCSTASHWRPIAQTA